VASLSADETTDLIASLRAEVSKAKGAFARADGQRMALERDLEQNAADKEELEALRTEVKSLRTKYSQAQGYQLALEREMLDKDEQITEYARKVLQAQKRFAQESGYRMSVERDTLAMTDDMTEQIASLQSPK
jgi:chromosome segregation ATPase